MTANLVAAETRLRSALTRFQEAHEKGMPATVEAAANDLLHAVQWWADTKREGA